MPNIAVAAAGSSLLDGRVIGGDVADATAAIGLRNLQPQLSDAIVVSDTVHHCRTGWTRVSNRAGGSAGASRQPAGATQRRTRRPLAGRGRAPVRHRSPNRLAAAGRGDDRLASRSQRLASAAKGCPDWARFIAAAAAPCGARAASAAATFPVNARWPSRHRLACATPESAPADTRHHTLNFRNRKTTAVHSKRTT